LTENNLNGLGIALFGFKRPELIKNTLTSLKIQNALKYVHLWIDGDHGDPTLQKETKKTYEIGREFNVKKIHRHRGNLGFRKLMLDAQRYMINNFSYIIFLEDDCFPVNGAINEFYDELKLIEDNDNIFSVYGHYFLVPEEKETITRFQGWGWGTTADKLKPICDELHKLYMLSEEEYLEFIRLNLNEDIKSIIDVTPGRQPSNTLRKFFAWDETLCLLCAKKGLLHKKTQKRTVYNCGAGQNSTHMRNIEYFRKPPLNMISPNEVWHYFDNDNYIHKSNRFKQIYYWTRYYISKIKSRITSDNN
jgi:hypothetical protein